MNPVIQIKAYFDALDRYDKEEANREAFGAEYFTGSVPLTAGKLSIILDISPK